MVKSHAFKLVPGSKRSKLAQARMMVSWTRSSALWESLHSDMAKARRLGMAASSWSRRDGSTSTTRPLLLDLELSDERQEVVGHGLRQQVGVHGPQPSLDVALHLDRHIPQQPVTPPRMGHDNDLTFPPV